MVWERASDHDSELREDEEEWAEVVRVELGTETASGEELVLEW